MEGAFVELLLLLSGPGVIHTRSNWFVVELEASTRARRGQCPMPYFSSLITGHLGKGALDYHDRGWQHHHYVVYAAVETSIVGHLRICLRVRSAILFVPRFGMLL